MTPQNLDDLLAAMQNATTADEFAALGLPVAQGEPDWTSLPTYGGEEPDDTTEIWSWDEDRLIAGTCADDVQIVPRATERTIIIDGEKRTEVFMHGPVRRLVCGYSNAGETYEYTVEPGFWRLLPPEDADDFPLTLEGSID